MSDYKEILTFIPLHDNDNVAFGDDLIDGIIEDIFETFGGCTKGAIGTGYWKESSETPVCVDTNFSLSFIVPANQVELARTKVLEIGKLLKQKQMLFKVMEADIDFLDC